MSDTLHEHQGQDSHSPPASLPRIGYLLSQYPARSHTFLLNEVLGLRARGLHVQVASINAPDRALVDLPPQEAGEVHSTFYVRQGGLLKSFCVFAATALAHPGVVLRGLRAISRVPALPLRKRAFWLFYLAEAMLLGRWMRRQHLSHLHVHFGGAVASVGMLTSIAWRVPYSLTIHGPEELLDPYGYQLSAKLGQADFVVCISYFSRDQLRRLLPAEEWQKLEVVRLGVDPLLLTPSLSKPATPGSSRTDFTIVCVGRLVPEKGHRMLLQALRMLLDRDLAFHAVLVGTGPLEAGLRSFAAREGMNDRVTFTSGLSHAETLAHVRNADTFALASFAEGVPVALMEAMSLGVPCVSTTIAGIPELIRSGENGLLVAPGDASAFADALQLLLADHALRNRLGCAGRRTVIAEYNLPRNLERLAQHFRERIAAPSALAHHPSAVRHP